MAPAPSSPPPSLLDALCLAGTEFYQRGWMLGTAGNLSVRDPRDPARYWITASGGHKGRLRVHDDFVGFLAPGMADATPAGRSSSAETIVHDLLYAADPAIGSVLHVHSPYVTLVSRALGAGRPLVLRGLEYIKGLGFWDEGATVVVPCVANHHDIPTLGQAVAEARLMDPRVPAVLVEGHGVYAWGETIAAAQRHIECLEFMAHIVWEEFRAPRGA